MKKLLVAFVALSLAAVSFAAPGDKTRAALTQPIPEFTAGAQASGGQPLREVIPAVSRAVGIPIIMDKDANGSVDFEVTGMTIRQFLTMVCASNGLNYVVHPDEYIVIRSKVVRLYPINFIAAERQVQSSSSMMLSATSSGGGGSAAGGGGAAAGGAAAGGAAGGGAGGNGGQSSVTISTKNDSLFWAELVEFGKSILLKDEVLNFNKTAGIAYLDASIGTHAKFESQWRAIHSRVNRGVRVKVEALNVDLSNQNQLGIDWQSAAFGIRGVFDGIPNGGFNIGNVFTASDGVTKTSNVNATTSGTTSVGSTQLQSSTFMGTIGIGKVSALISALQTQGDVHKSSSPVISLLNNRTSVLQVSLDKNFFSKSQDYEVSSTNSSSTVANGTKYSASTYSFGIMFTVTAQIAESGVVTLDLEPVLTDFVGIERSVDGSQERPSQNKQSFNTQIQLRSGQSHVMSGYIRTVEGKEVRAVPFLSAIPYLGRAFRNEATVKSRSEVVIIVTAELTDLPDVKPIEVITPDPSQGVTAEVSASVVSAPVVVPAPTPAASPADSTSKQAKPEPSKSTLLPL